MNFASLTEWWDLDLPLIDVRESQEERALSSAESRVVVYLPFSTLVSGERSCELPPRHVAFGILVEEDHDEAQKEQRQQKLQDFFFATTSKATQQSRKPWQVSVALIASDDLWEQSKKIGIYKSVDNLQCITSTFEPLSRLWQPDLMLPNILWPILEQSLPLIKEDCEIWDLGSGAGRDACFLAEKIKALSLKHCSVIGIDNHKGSAKRCEPFWKHRQVAELTRAENLNLNKMELVEQQLKGGTVVCFNAVRFLNRKLNVFLAGYSDLKPGTLFAVSHFCKPYPGASWDFDHPKVSLILLEGKRQLLGT